MRTMFERSFSTSFGAQPIHGFRPFSLGQVKLLGQDYGPFQEEPWTPPEDFATTYTYPETPASPWTTPPTPQYTAQGPQQQFPTPPLPTERPAGTSDTDWAKILAEGFKAVGTGYGVYSQASIAKMKAQAEILRAKNPTAAKILPSTMDTTTKVLLVLGGIAVVGVGLVFALK